MSNPAFRLDRLPTGITGLDTLLNGGLIESCIYLLMGIPGSGKTVLANQICFNHAGNGGRVVYITLLAEPNIRMLKYIQKFSYFDDSLLPDRITYLSVFATLEREGIDGLILLLQQEILRLQPTLMVIDGFAVAGEISDSAVAFKKFVHQLNIFASTTGCTVILMSSIADGYDRPEHTMVDGLIVTTLSTAGMRTFREIEIRKLRGSPHLQGRHAFTIGDEGITVFPRLESLPVSQIRGPTPHHKMSMGILALDQIIGGGVDAGSITRIVGNAGSGKTLLGLHFLQAGVSLNQPCLFFGFYEWPEQLLKKAKRFGIDVGPVGKRSLLHIAWHQPTELSIDAMAHSLLSSVREGGIKRVFIDGIDALLSCDTSNRSISFMSALSNNLRLLGVSVLMTEESSPGTDPLSGILVPSATENVIRMMQIEVEGHLHRTLTVIKLRDGNASPVVHPFAITDQGLALGPAEIAAPPLRRKPTAKVRLRTQPTGGKKST